MDHAEHPGFQGTNSERSPAPPYNGQSTSNVRPTTVANVSQRRQFDGILLYDFSEVYLSQLFCKGQC